MLTGGNSIPMNFSYTSSPYIKFPLFVSEVESNELHLLALL